MLISDLIKKLQYFKNHYGDLDLSTWDGMVRDIKMTPCKDGGCIVLLGESKKPVELSLEIESKS
jgi:hypothetical protein